MKKFSLVLAALALLATPAKTLAGPIPYPTPGTENPATYTFTATATGNVVAYFYGASASYGSLLSMSVNGGAYNPPAGALQNHLTPIGTSANLGAVTIGDVLVFQLAVSTTNPNGPPPTDYSLYSNKALNSDLKQHIYSTDFSGVIPTTAVSCIGCTYIGFEDIIPATNPPSDLDYNDHQFVFQNVGLNQTSVPDGGSALALLGVALTGLGMLRRRLS